MAVWSRLQSLIFGAALGAASEAAIGPQIEPARQLAWSKNQNRILDVNSLARLVAQGLIDEGSAADEASREGYAEDKIAALIQLSLIAPPVAEALVMRRRGEIGDAELKHAYAKAQIEPAYWPGLDTLIDERLDPAVIANAIVRGIMAAPFPLPVPPPSAVGKIPAFPTSKLDTTAEAKSSGYDADRLFVLTAIAGRPMSPEGAAAAVFKAILERVDFDRAIAEGDVRNEWADAIFENARPIPHPLDYVQAHLRGWTDLPGMHTGAQRSGMADADTDLLFLIHGRPPSWHQVWIGLQRGGVYDGPIDIIDPAFLKALRESDLRPEWYNLLWHSRYNYPSPFVLRQLTQSGAITLADAEQVLKFEGYEPTFAAKIATAWAGGSAATTATDAHVKKAQTSLYTAAHSSYVKRESDAAAVRPVLTTLGVPAAAQADVLALWDAERALIHAELTPAQIKKAVKGAVPNPSTGQPWTLADAIAALLARGYDLADAETFLAE